MLSRYLKMALVLGLLSAIGPFAIDMYLPALPDIGRSLGAEVGAVQLTLTAFFLSIGLGQLLYGPVSDMVGRKPPLYAGLALFTLASIGCALATDIHTLVALRFLQGLGAAAGMAIPRAIVRDLHTGAEAARLMSLLMLVFSVSPILAPLAGSGVIALTGWRGVFWVVALAAVAGMLLVRGALAETRSEAERVDSSLGSALRGYGVLLRDRHFLALAVLPGLGAAGLMSYVVGSPFVLREGYGLSANQFALLFAVNGMGLVGGAQVNAWLVRRYAPIRIIRVIVPVSLGLGLVLLAVGVTGAGGLPALLVVLWLALALVNVTPPNASALALGRHGEMAGTAAAFIGGTQAFVSGIIAPLVGVLGGTTLAMTGVMAGASLAQRRGVLAILRAYHQPSRILTT